MKTNTLPRTDVLHARAAISTIIEPGDGVAGTLIDALGPVAAYDAITGNGLQAALQDAGVGERTAQESISRWTPRISSLGDRPQLASLERANVTLIDPDTIPALSDLGAHRPRRPVRPRQRVAPHHTAPHHCRGSQGVDRVRRAHHQRDRLRPRRAPGHDPQWRGLWDRRSRAPAPPSQQASPPSQLSRWGRTPYPAGHSELITRIAERGAVVSEVPMDTAPSKCGSSLGTGSWRLSPE